MKLISLVNELMSEGLNLPKKVKPIYSYQKKCYKDGDPHGWHEMSNDDECHWAKWLHDELNLIVETGLFFFSSHVVSAIIYTE